MMNPSEPKSVQYYGSFFGPEGEHCAKIRVIDAGDDWVYEVGVDGDSIGLTSVTISKFRVNHLNFIGALRVALYELDQKRQQHKECGAPLYSRNDPKELENGNAEEDRNGSDG